MIGQGKFPPLFPSELLKELSSAIMSHTYVSTEVEMGSTKLDRDKQAYEAQQGPLHPWVEFMDDRTGYAWCQVCVDRKLPWLQNKSMHPATEITEEYWH